MAMVEGTQSVTRGYFAVRMGMLALICGLGASAPANARGAQPLHTVIPESVGFSSERLRRLDALMLRAINDRLYGGIVSLVARHGKIALYSAVGKPNQSLDAADDNAPTMRELLTHTAGFGYDGTGLRDVACDVSTTPVSSLNSGRSVRRVSQGVQARTARAASGCLHVSFTHAGDLM